MWLGLPVLCGIREVKYLEIVAFLYANSELTEMEIKKTIPFTIATKKIKIPGNKSDQGCKRPSLGKL